MKRGEQMMNAAEAYAAGCYEGWPVSFSTDEYERETINDFCAGWRAAVEKACEWMRAHLGVPEDIPQAKAYEDAMNELISKFRKAMEE